MTIGFTIVIGVIVYLPSIHPPIKVTLSIPFVPLVASMACRVFRNIKLFDFDTVPTNPISNIQFAYNTASASRP